jgi:hypothetical protein
VRRDSERGILHPGHHLAGRLDQCGEAVGRAQEAPLPMAGLDLSEAAEPVEHRQQGEADARLAGSLRDRAGHGAKFAIGPAVHIMMQVVELAHGGEAGLQHLHIGLRRDGGDIKQGGRQILGQKPRSRPRHAAVHRADQAAGAAALGGFEDFKAPARGRVHRHGAPRLTRHRRQQQRLVRNHRAEARRPRAEGLRVTATSSAVDGPS